MIHETEKELLLRLYKEFLQMSEKKTAQLENRQYKNMKVIWPCRERGGREVGGGIGMGKTCEPKAFSFQFMTKFTTNKI